jgi:hypothetical protein
MSDEDTTTSVKSEEWLSRFILHKSHVRHDNTLRADPFIPHPLADLSVTRHLELNETSLWSIGEDVAILCRKNLYGRAENQADIYLSQKLSVFSQPVPGNTNHANVTGWPIDKPAQKIIALEIAARSHYVPRVEG